MTAAWLLLAGALALVPLGSTAAVRLAALSTVDTVDAVDTIDSADGPGLQFAVGLSTAIVAAVGAAVVGVVVWLAGPVVGAAAAVAALTAASLVRQRRATRAASRAAQDALDIVRLVQAEVEAGTTAPDAIVAAEVLDTVFGADLSALADALRQARDPTDGIAEQLQPMAHALRVSATSGAGLAGVLRVVAVQLQSGVDRSTALAGALAGARSSAALLAVLPAVGLALGAALGADPLHVLFSTGGGRMLLFGGVALESLGLLWTSRLAASAERT